MLSRSSLALRQAARLRVSRSLHTTPKPPAAHSSGVHEVHHPTAHSSAAVDEAFPSWVLYALGASVSIFFISKFIHPSEDNFISRALAEREDKWAEELAKNDRHTRLVEQAARDRNLFQGSQPSPTIPLRFPERFNAHSPMNNVAGWTKGRSLPELEAHYNSLPEREVPPP